MIKGILERRTANRIPFKTALKIKFVTSDVQTTFTANTVNISAGGLQFATPEKIPGIGIGDTLKFVFDLPDLGKTSVIAEITYYAEYDASTKYPGQVCYGVKFLEMSLDTWSKVVEHCGMMHLVGANELTSPDDINVATTTVSVENKETIVEKKSFTISLQLPDGTESKARLEDISFGGVRVNVTRPISVNTQISVNICYQGHPYHLSGVCVWSITDSAEGYIAGIFFDELTKEQFNDLTTLIHQLHR